jgi:hypothetical protein
VSKEGLLQGMVSKEGLLQGMVSKEGQGHRNQKEA